MKKKGNGKYSSVSLENAALMLMYSHLYFVSLRSLSVLDNQESQGGCVELNSVDINAAIA